MKPAGSNFPTDFESLADVVDCRSPALVACRTVWVASSRLPKKLDTIPEFFDALLKLASQLDPTKDSLITARGTTCHDFVCRIGQLFQIPVVTLHVENDSAKWERLKDTLSGNSSDIAVLDSEKVGVDFLLGMLACEVFVLSIRPNGNLHRAVSSRLEHGKKTRVVIGNPLVKKSLVDQLLDHGATGWYLMKGLESESPTDPQPCSVIAADDFDSSSYLLHWTRRRTGPWPDESDSKFLDDLIFGCSGKDHAVLSVLKRILAMERIVAGSKLTRSPRPVVCFSDLTFQQLQKRRVFRAHLSRWDFEPFGFGIAKSWLSSQGAQPVTYGDESVWNSMASKDKPFFQLKREQASVDWSIEKEWRIIGDVDLKRVPADCGVVFVPTIQDAAEIGSLSRWPVVVLSDQVR